MRLLILLLFIPFIASSQVIMTARYTAKSVGGCVSALLDTYTGSSAAYSLRKLRTAYSGSAIRVRRSSDNTEQDIGFTGTCNTLDTSSLKSFVGANNGFVVTWYDQSGNARNLTQSTSANQPRIVNSGTVERDGTLPAVYFTGSPMSLSVTNFLSGTSAATLYFVAKNDADPPTCNNCGAIVDNTGNPFDTHFPFSDGNIYDGWATDTRKTVGNPSNSLTNKFLYCAISASADWRSYINNTSFFTTTSNTVSVTNDFYVGRSKATYNWVGKLSEIIVYNSASSNGDRNGISGNINSYYTIY